MKISDERVREIFKEVAEERGVSPTLHIVPFNLDYASVRSTVDGPAKVKIGRNLLDLLETEDQLAFAFGHELSHDFHDNTLRNLGLVNQNQVEAHADFGGVSLMDRLGRSRCAGYHAIKAIADDHAERTGEHSDMAEYRLARLSPLCSN